MVWADVAADFSILVFPENLDAFRLFASMGTQWRCGPAGFYGLDYNVIYHKLDRMQLDADRFSEIECDVRILESAALDEMNRGIR